MGVGRLAANIAAALLICSATLALASEPARKSLRLTPSDFGPIDEAKAELGRLLFYDPVLSGNRNISCGTCHNHDLAGADGVSLGIGEGGKGVGPDRVALEGPGAIRKRIPRNAPALWNLGAKEIHTLFHDGRLEKSDVYGNGFNSPAEEWLPEGLESLLAAQALFPLTAQFEMAGNPKENEIAGAVHDRIDAAWPIVASRIRAIGAYEPLFTKAFDDVSRSADITIVHIVNALGAFIDGEWRSFDSPYDRWLTGDDNALTPQQKNGRDLFFGPGNCASCHSGKLMSDQKFHALALPHFGPGRTRLFDPSVRDTGRMAETDDLDDAYRFRTPMLRNVALTAPYGHNGAYPTLEGIIRHHLDPVGSLDKWQAEQAKLPPVPWLAEVDFVAFEDRRERLRLRSKVDIEPVDLRQSEIADLVAFLNALTGGKSRHGRLGKPDAVPSGLEVD